MQRMAGRVLIALGVLLLVAPLAVWATGVLGGSTLLLVIAPDTLLWAAGGYAGLCCALVVGGVTLIRMA